MFLFLMILALHPFTLAGLLGLGALFAGLGFMIFGTAIAQPSINTLLQLGNNQSPETYVTVANVGDITGPGFSGNVVDVTSHSTTVPWREKIVTLLDAGQVSCKVYFIPGDPGHQALFTVFVNRTLEAWNLVYPDTNHSTINFNAYISKFAITATVAGVIEAAMTLEVVSEPTFWGSIPG